ncbi:MAG: UDP-N-acetylglucosamine--N-acetylmuramyl-(pentapeptide) pyrophosphoryl-undecaprenol N-acetylglucosamine transferase [Acidimicrobiales bacterium]
MTERAYAVISGGGTGGHVYEALAIARALAERGHPAATIEMCGSRRGQEAVLLADEAFPLTLLPGRGIVRRWSRADLAANVEAVGGLAWGVGLALALAARRRPKVIVSVGGYASFPADLAAVLLGVPLVLVTIDAVPGLVHRLFARRAAANAVAFPGTSLPRAVVTGVAVRPEIVAVDRSPDAVSVARAALGIPKDRPAVGVVGGSLGARRLNEAARELGGRWAARGDRSLYHVTGRRNWEEMQAEPGGPAGNGGSVVDGGLARHMVPFELDMASLYSAVDIMVCRAGASTVAELTVTGVPSVLVPLPGAPSDHQGANARALVDAGAAVLLPDDDCDGAALESVLDGLLSDRARLDAMSAAARALGRPDAAARVAELVEVSAR